MNKKPLKIKLTELFMAKAGRKGFDRCFHGIITRNIDENGDAVFFSKIYVKRYGFNEVLYSSACDPALDSRDLRDKLGEQLDELVLLVLDYGLTKMKPAVEDYGEININLN